MKSPTSRSSSDRTPLIKNTVGETLYDPDAITESSDDSRNSLHDNKDDNGDTTHQEKYLLVKLVLAAGAASSSLGYDVGIMAAAILPLEADMKLSSVEKESVMGSLNFVAAFGAMLGGKIADQYGRKATLRVCAWLLIVGAALMAFASNFAMLIAGRLVSGMGVGVAFVVVPVFLTEIAPSEHRGKLGTVVDVATNVGILLGYVSGFLVQLFSPENWRLMLGCGAILPLIVLLFLANLPESPRWSMMAKQKSEALQALQRLGNSRDEATKMISDMEDEIRKDQERPNVWWSPGLKLAVGFGIFQQLGASEAVLYYTADFLARAGMDSQTMRLLGNCMVGLCKLIPECFAMYFIDSIGRRPLMLASSICRFLSLVALSLAFYLEAPPIVVVILLCVIMVSFSIGIGPFTFLCATENLSVQERAMGTTYSAATNRLTSGLVALTVVSLYDTMGDANMFGLYSVLAFGTIFFYWNVPETAGQSLEEIQASRRSKGSGRGQDPGGEADEEAAVSEPSKN